MLRRWGIETIKRDNQTNSSKRRANARNVSTSFLPYGGITYFINSFDYPFLLFWIGLFCYWIDFVFGWFGLFWFVLFFFNNFIENRPERKTKGMIY